MQLTPEQVATQLAQLPQWRHLPQERGGAIEREFVFTDFAQAMGFMTQVALVAEKRDHHPEWSNVYNRVHVLLTTHDVQGLSDKDMALARYMDGLAQALAGQEVL